MAKRSKPAPSNTIQTYEHHGQQRVNNPPAGLVTPDTDPDLGLARTYAYDPHLDPQLQWAGKAEHTSFEVPTVSLHVHERIDPRTIIEAVRQKPDPAAPVQLSLFQSLEENPPLREAIEFYRHAHGWSNRLVAGDSLLVMNSLLEKEGMAGKVQMVYIDPPYGIKYGSNFQPFVNKRDVTDGKDEDLTAEPEQVRAFRDTWELGIHSYLAYLRDRLLLSRELLSESGSIFVQISDANIHLVRCLLDDVFNSKNFCAQISFRTATSQPSTIISSVADILLWYSRDREKVKYKSLFRDRNIRERVSTFGWVELPDGTSRPLSSAERNLKTVLPEGKLFKDADITERNELDENIDKVIFDGREYSLPHRLKYRDGIDRLIHQNRIVVVGDRLCGKRYEYDMSGVKYTNIWDDTIQGTFELTIDPKRYVVQTNPKVITRCLLMTTDPGDLVFDPTCGSGTTAYVAEKWGRRWITCDTSRVSLTLAKQRLMTALYDYYGLSHPNEGVGSGFIYKTVPHVTLKSIANNEPLATETLYDQPLVDNKKHRVSGPFTVEAVPAPAVRSVDQILAASAQPADTSIARSGETLRQGEWRDELLRTGIRGKSAQHIRFARLEPLPGCRWLHADGETRPSAEGADWNGPQKVDMVNVLTIVQIQWG